MKNVNRIISQEVVFFENISLLMEPELLKGRKGQILNTLSASTAEVRRIEPCLFYLRNGCRTN